MSKIPQSETRKHQKVRYTFGQPHEKPNQLVCSDVLDPQSMYIVTPDTTSVSYHLDRMASFRLFKAKSDSKIELLTNEIIPLTKLHCVPPIRTALM